MQPAQCGAKLMRDGTGLKLAEAAPPRHQQEKAEVKQRTDLRDALADRRRRQHAEIAQHQEIDDKNAVQVFVPARAIADRTHFAVVEPGQEEQDDDRSAHHQHTPEFGVDGQHGGRGADGNGDDDDLEHRADLRLQRREGGCAQHAGNQHIHHLAGDRPQHRVVRREIPDRCDVQRRLQRIGRNEVVVFEEIAAQLGREENHGRENHQEHADGKNVVHRVIRVKRNAVHRMALGVFRRVGALDLDTVGVVRADLMQRNDVRRDQADQHQRHGNHVKREEAVQRGVANHVVAANQQCQIGADERNGGQTGSR